MSDRVLYLENAVNLTYYAGNDQAAKGYGTRLQSRFGQADLTVFTLNTAPSIYDNKLYNYDEVIDIDK